MSEPFSQSNEGEFVYNPNILANSSLEPAVIELLNNTHLCEEGLVFDVTVDDLKKLGVSSVKTRLQTIRLLKELKERVHAVNLSDSVNSADALDIEVVEGVGDVVAVIQPTPLFSSSSSSISTSASKSTSTCEDDDVAMLMVQINKYKRTIVDHEAQLQALQSEIETHKLIARTQTELASSLKIQIDSIQKSTEVAEVGLPKSPEQEDHKESSLSPVELFTNGEEEEHFFHHQLELAKLHHQQEINEFKRELESRKSEKYAHSAHILNLQRRLEGLKEKLNLVFAECFPVNFGVSGISTSLLVSVEKGDALTLSQQEQISPEIMHSEIRRQSSSSMSPYSIRSPDAKVNFHNDIETEKAEQAEIESKFSAIKIEITRLREKNSSNASYIRTRDIGIRLVKNRAQERRMHELICRIQRHWRDARHWNSSST